MLAHAHLDLTAARLGGFLIQAAVSALLLLAPAPVVAQPLTPAACEMTPDEAAQVKLTASRAERRLVPEPSTGVEGCGLWRIEVSAKGDVRSVELLRSEATKGYEKQFRRPIMRTTYSPSDADWSGLIWLSIRSPG